MGFRAAIGGTNSGATANTDHFTVTFTGASPGDAAVVWCQTNSGSDTMSTPSGWDLIAGPYTQSSNTRGYLFGKKALTSGDISGGQVFTYSSTGRLIAVGVILDHTVAAWGTAVEVQAAASSATQGSATMVSNGDDVIAVCGNRLATASSHSTTTFGGIWTKQQDVGTNYATSPNMGAAIATLTTPIAAAASTTAQTTSTSPAALQVILITVEALGAVQPPTGGGTGQAFAPAVSGGSNPDGTVAAALASGTGQAFAPAVVAGATALPPLAAGTAQAFAPALTTGAAQLPPLAAATGQAFAPTVSGVRNPTVAPPLAAGSGQGFAPTVSGSATVLAARATGTGQAFAPTVGAVTDAAVSPPRASGTAQAFAPTVSAGATVLPPRAAGTGAAPAPVVAAGATTAPPRATGTGQALAPALTAAAVVLAPRASGTGAALDPLVVASAIVEAALAAMLGEAFPPAVSAFNPRDISVRSTLDGPDTSSSLTPYTVTAVLDRPTTRATLEDE